MTDPTIDGLLVKVRDRISDDPAALWTSDTMRRVLAEVDRLRAAYDRVFRERNERAAEVHRLRAALDYRIKELEAEREAFEAEAVEPAMRIHRERIKHAEARLARVTEWAERTTVTMVIDGVPQHSGYAEAKRDVLSEIRAVAADEQEVSNG